MEYLAVILFPVLLVFLYWLYDRSFDKESARQTLLRARNDFVLHGGVRELQFLRVAEAEYKKLGGVVEPWPLQKGE